MAEHKFAVVACLGAVLAVVSLVWLSQASASGAIGFPTRDSAYVSFSDNVCGPGMMPLTGLETRYGTGKIAIECVPQGTIHSSSVPFPALRQRYRSFVAGTRPHVR